MSRRNLDHEAEVEGEALTLAMMHGVKPLTDLGLRPEHLTKENKLLWRAIAIASAASEDGIPVALHLHQILANTEDSGIPAGEIGSTFAKIASGTGDPASMKWVAGEVLATAARRQMQAEVALLQAILSGDREGDPGEVLARLAKIDPSPSGTASPLQMLDNRAVTLSAPPPAPGDSITIAAQSICSAGNLTVISGQSKSGKSSAVAALLASTLAPGEDRDFLGFASAPTDGKAVLLFDSEQSPFDAWQMQSRILRRAGVADQPGNFLHSYMLDLGTQERREAVFAAIKREHKRRGVHLAVIDGVADLIDDPNDQAASNLLVSDLVALSVEVAAPIVLILHENPAAPGGAGKTRGHLGSQLERKAESNLRIIKETDGASLLFGEKCRRANLPQSGGQRFQWDDDLAMHVSCAPAAAGKAEKERVQHEEILAVVFGSSDSAGGLAWKDILAKIGEAESKTPGGARKTFDRMKAAGVIRKSTTTGFWIR